MPSTTSRLLSTRNLRILLDVARFKLVTTEQIRQLHFDHLAEDSEAPRMLLYRLFRAGLVDKLQTHARSTTSTDGLTVTKPKPVWYMTPKCYGTLKNELSRSGRAADYSSFEDHNTRIGHRNSFSDQSLPHEIGITSILIAFEHGATNTVHIEDLTWVRTSPRHPLISTSVTFQNNMGRRCTRTINPDALVFFRAAHKDKRYPFFFFIEYETGTANAQKYVLNKLEPYVAWAEQLRNGSNNRPFSKIAEQFNREYGLGLNRPERIPFRVLTIARERNHALNLLVASPGFSNNKLCLFTSLDAFVANPFGKIWTRAAEFDTEFQADYEQLLSKRPRPSVVRRWIAQELGVRISRVSIP